ncbi:MAG: serine/threonine protein kinase, partial [Catenulispora sp.]|nr:serine/threonine protein kinase [Catenulispora sp.]
MEVTERYVLGRLVGEGATSCVYEATDTELDREVAVKVFRATDTGDGLSERFREEIRILTSLVHPHLLPLHDTGRDADGRRFLVMPLVRGTTLARLTARGPVPPREVKRIGKALAEALAHIHARGIVHRDVKPSNVLLAEDGTPYLADFGFAHADDGPALTATNCVVGTAGYLAPEQAEGLPVPPVADVYALGLVLLEALTGERTYRGTPFERAAANALRPPTIPARLGPGWMRVLRTMTTRDPALRPTADEARVLLDQGEDVLPEVRAADDTVEITPVLTGGPDFAEVGAPDVAGRAGQDAAGAAGQEAAGPGALDAAGRGALDEVMDAAPATRRSHRRLATVGASAFAAVAVFGLGVGTNWLAFGDSGGVRTPAPTGPDIGAGVGAGAAGPQQSTTPTQAPTTPATVPTSTPAAAPTTRPVAPSPQLKPADQAVPPAQ